MATAGRQPWRWAVLLGLAAGVLSAWLWLAGTLDRAENLTWDWRVRRAAAASTASDSIVLVLLDQASLDWGRETNGWSWPWPREIYTAVLGFCRRGGARTVTFDVLFTEPSLYGVADDVVLGDGIAVASDAIVACHVDGDGNVTWPVPEIRAGAARLGDVAGQPDNDGVVRRARLAVAVGDTTVAGLGLATYLVAENDRPPFARSPLNSRVLAFAPAGTYTTFGADDIVQAELQLLEGREPVVDPEVLRSRHVFFGFSAPGLLDQRATPLSRVNPGVVVHATVLDNLLTDGFIRPAARVWAIVATVFLGVVAALLALRFGRAWQQVLLFAVGLILPLAAGWLLYRGGWWWPVMPGMIATAGGLVGGLGINWATEGRQRRFLKQAFRHYLSPHVVDRLVQDPDRLQLGGERRTLTIMFADLADFTVLGENLDPVDLTALLNAYLTVMTDIILEEGGTLDKYEGDAIIAFWNAPLDVPDHALRACRAAVRCQRAIRDRRDEWHHHCGRDLRMRIGLHTGPVVVGNLGSRQRFDYTILGDAANLASRLEGANKAFGTGTMVSEATMDASRRALPHRELGRVQVVGREEPITVFELDHSESADESATWSLYRQALEHCRAGKTAEAIALLGGIPDDNAAAALLIQLQSDPDFRGLWRLQQK